jgi:magnesium transporter
MNVQLYKYNADSFQMLCGKERDFCTTFYPEKEKEFTFWLNFRGLQEREALIVFCEKLKLDRILQERIFSVTKRPRLEEYPGYIFFSIVSVLPSTNSSLYQLEKECLSFIVGDNYLISFQENNTIHFDDVRSRIEHKRGKIRFKGPDFLLFRLLESIIDNYYEVTENCIQNIVLLDKKVLESPSNDLLRKIEWEKRKLVDLRKVVFPMKELMVQIDAVENKLIVEENNLHFKQLKDSCYGILEEIDSQKLMLDGIANLYYAGQGQRMNEIMKVLTVISAIFIPLTFIVGVYGMNFKNMPELETKYGYFIALFSMFMIGSGLVIVFWKRGWLKRNE